MNFKYVGMQMQFDMFDLSTAVPFEDAGISSYFTYA